MPHPLDPTFSFIPSTLMILLCLTKYFFPFIFLFVFRIEKPTPNRKKKTNPKHKLHHLDLGSVLIV